MTHHIFAFISADFPFMRKKKHPDVAYKSHEFFDMSLAPGYPHRSSGSDAVDSRTEVSFYNKGSFINDVAIDFQQKIFCSKHLQKVWVISTISRLDRPQSKHIVNI